MSVNYIPKEHHTVTPYIMVEGVEQVMDFLTATFGAESRSVMKSPDGRVMHAQILVGDSMLMLAEAKPPEWMSQPASFYLYVPDCDSAYQKALAVGATSIMEPADQFYGDRHGGVRDASGNSWWMATHIEDVSDEEMKRRTDEWAKKQSKS
jgi:PhnB protein